MTGPAYGEHSSLWGTIPQKGVVLKPGRVGPYMIGASVRAIERNFSEDLVAVLGNQSIYPISKWPYQR
jgi:hypothetical protein